MTAPQTGFTFNLGNAGATTTAPTLNFGSATPSTGISFGNSANLNKGSTVTTSTGLSLGSLPSSTAGQSTSLNFTTSTLTSQPQQTSFSFGGAPATNVGAAASPFSLGNSSTPATKAVTFNVLPVTSSQPSAPTSGQPANVTTELTANIQSMTFSELEVHVKKWQIMIDEHQRLFYNKVNELNATDKMLYENRVKLEKFKEFTEEATARKNALQEELNSIDQQQKELNEIVTSLEKEVEKIELPADTERAQTYKLADTLDLQVRKISGELKEIIENINAQNNSQNLSDPIVQISRIINAQVNTLTKLDHKVAVLNEDIEAINNVHKQL